MQVPLSLSSLLLAICAGRVGSAFAAELGTMAVSEQTDSLRVLGSDPVDYLITPRTLACMIAGPILNLMCFVMGERPSLVPQMVACAFHGDASQMRNWILSARAVIAHIMLLSLLL